MLRSKAVALLAIFMIALGSSLALSSPSTAAPAVDTSVTSAKVAKNVMDCSGLGSVPLQRQMSFGNSNWVAQMGTRSDGIVGFKVFHPSGRWDRYRIRVGMNDGTVYVAQEYYTSFCYSGFVRSQVRWVEFEADNGYGWKLSPRWWL